MLHRFKWTSAARHRNRILAEAEVVQPFYLLALAQAAQCRTFLDVGANIGAYSLFATQLPELERCIAIEANPMAAKELRANIALNVADIEVIEEAASDHDGEVTFGVVNDLAGDNAVLDTALRESFNCRIVIPAFRLDRFADLPDPLCLKIDVEGHELAVLSGATKLLEKPSIIQVEDFAAETSATLAPLGYFKLTVIGPDHYFSNIERLRGRALEIYEKAMSALIESMSEANYGPHQITRRFGDFTLRIEGKNAVRLRKAKQFLCRPFG